MEPQLYGDLSRLEQTRIEFLAGSAKELVRKITWESCPNQSFGHVIIGNDKGDCPVCYSQIWYKTYWNAPADAGLLGSVVSVMTSLAAMGHKLADQWLLENGLKKEPPQKKA